MLLLLLLFSFITCRTLVAVIFFPPCLLLPKSKSTTCSFHTIHRCNLSCAHFFRFEPALRGRELNCKPRSVLRVCLLLFCLFACFILPLATCCSADSRVQSKRQRESPVLAHRVVRVPLAWKRRRAQHTFPLLGVSHSCCHVSVQPTKTKYFSFLNSTSALFVYRLKDFCQYKTVPDKWANT